MCGLQCGIVGPGLAEVARLRDRALIAVRVSCSARLRGRVSGVSDVLAAALRVFAFERVELTRVAALASAEQLVDSLAEASATVLVFRLDAHRVCSSVVVEVVLLVESPCSSASISAR